MVGEDVGDIVGEQLHDLGGEDGVEEADDCVGLQMQPAQGGDDHDEHGEDTQQQVIGQLSGAAGDPAIQVDLDDVRDKGHQGVAGFEPIQVLIEFFFQGHITSRFCPDLLRFYEDLRLL